jgi:AcrR family transcriptional regulator
VIDDGLRKRVVAFLRPLYQDLDGGSRFEDVERVASIARRLYTPAENDARAFELLLLFHGLGRWIEKIGNRSRAVLVTGLSDAELRSLASSIRRLGEPTSDGERAVASAILIDSAGVRGLAERLSRSRREGSSVIDVVRDVLADAIVPEWMPESARKWLVARHAARREVCRRILEEMELKDLG